MKLRASGLLLAAAVLVRAAELAAQNPPSLPSPDTARAAGVAGGDTSRTGAQRRDTIPLPDSLSPDSFRPQLPPLGAPPGPLPKAGRIVFGHDELWFSGALTLGELLQRVPGVFLVRAGWFGRPEVVQYAGQGASSIEVYWDGFALDPLGQDSTGLDLSEINLGLVQRVEVEVLPSVVRVYLYSDDQTVRKPRTETSFATGDAGTNSYRIRYLNRWKNGTGIDLGVNFLGGSGVVNSPGRSSDLTLWAKGSWIPTDRYGVEYQVMSYSIDRDSVKLGSDSRFLSAVPSRRTHRTDMFLRGFVATRGDGMGLRLDAIAGGSSYSDTAAALSRQEMQGSMILGYRAQRWSSELTTRVRDSDTPLEVELRAAASPAPLLTMSGYAVSRSHLGGRRSTEAGVQAELRPFAAVAVHGAFRARNAVGAPVLLTDTAQKVQDVTVGVSLNTRPLDLDVSLGRHAVYAPPVVGTFGPIVPAYPSFAVRTATVSFAYRPTAYITFSGWYREPLVHGTAELLTSAYEPPHHSRIWATFRSRLLPVLRRGAFDFTAEAGMEGWGRGAWGVDASGIPMLLKGATVLDYRIELRLLNAALFWTIRNARGERYSVLPGLPMPVGGQSYGVRWEFTN
ncbi:MAG TPA: TonB-dependent receptor plug domain-containing protein [Gemmatimonadales bacterium]|nr:TonB-dependent receptor plug domain-containing protein [Gemmatimonadales bacterium]